MNYMWLSIAFALTFLITQYLTKEQENKKSDERVGRIKTEHKCELIYNKIQLLKCEMKSANVGIENISSKSRDCKREIENLAEITSKYRHLYDKYFQINYDIEEHTNLCLWVYTKNLVNDWKNCKEYKQIIWNKINKSLYQNTSNYNWIKTSIDSLFQSIPE